MLLFKRILDFKQATLDRLRNKRKGLRHPVGPAFPLRGTLSLRGDASVSCDWSGTPADLSATGASLLLPSATVTTRGEKTILRLAIEQHTLQLPCVVTHFRARSTHAVCGLALEFPDFTAQKAYAQLLEAVRIGADFVAVKNSPLAPCPPGLRLEQYRADARARLAVWRRDTDQKIESFELVLGDHCLRGEADGPTLEAYARQAGGDSRKVARSDPAYNLSAEVTGEVRQLFRWVLPNLTKAVPADVHTFLQHVITATRTPGERKVAQAFPAPASFPPPRRPALLPAQTAR